MITVHTQLASYYTLHKPDNGSLEVKHIPFLTPTPTKKNVFVMKTVVLDCIILI